MKKILSFCSLLFVLIVFPLFSSAQNRANSWVYKTEFKILDSSADSGMFKTNVSVLLNSVVVADSSLLIFKIGYIEGSDELYHSEILFTPALFSDSTISVINGILRFNLGEFDMPKSKYPTVLEIMMK